MIRLSRHLLLPALALLGLCLPATAGATPKQVIRDCVDDGQLSRKYSNSDLRKARDNLPSDLDEYSDCREVISAAIKRGPGPNAGGSPGGPGGGANQPSAVDAANFANSADEQAARAKDQQDLDAITGSGEPPTVDVGGETVTPGKNGLFDLASAANQLPMPLLLSLIALGLATLGGLAFAMRSKLPALAEVPLLSKIKIPRVPRFRR